MGEAKQRAAALAAWVRTLSPDERRVFDASRATYERVIQPLGATGMCYRMSFFLKVYLALVHGVTVESVVGYVNDQTDQIMIPHAWIEFGGKKTDISLTQTEHPDVQLTGPLLILDREMTKGRAAYTYHREQDATGVAQFERLLKDDRVRDMLRAKKAEHELMTNIAKDPHLMREFLDAAPDGLTFERLSGMISGAVSQP